MGVFRFNSKLTIRELDESKLMDDLHEAIVESYKEALKAFFIAAIEKVPVKTGMARGSFGPLAKFLDEQIDLSEAVPDDRRGRSAAAGEAGTIFTTNFNFPKYSMTLCINVLHYRLMDHFAMVFNKYTPWLSFEAGKQAFQDHFKENLKQNIPSIKRYMTKGTDITNKR